MRNRVPARASTFRLAGAAAGVTMIMNGDGAAADAADDSP